MTSRWLVTVGLLWAGLARADRTIVVDITGPAPFDADQLAAAIRIRLPAEGEPVRVMVTPAKDGVEVATTGGSRQVALVGLTGEAAARLVALAMQDLAPDSELVGAPPAVPLALGHEVDAQATAPRVRAAEVEFLGAVAAWAGMLRGGSVSLILPRRHWHYGFELGAGRPADAPLEITTGTLRAVVGVDAGMLRLQGGLTVMPMQVSDGRGDATALVGAGASVRLRLAVTPRVRAVTAIGADVFANRTDYRVGGMATLVTPWWTPWFGLGIEVTP